MTDFMSSEPTLAWLGQFKSDDQATAIALLEAMLLVPHDVFADRLQALVVEVANGAGQVGLYVERELPMRMGVPNRLFKEQRRKVKRAIGLGPKPVDPTSVYHPEVGSEGLVAQLATELVRQFPKVFLNHPGPDVIRKHKVRRFLVLTDFIGSGKRTRNYIQAAWRVRSVRSWWSQKWLRFDVVAYAATSEGRRFVEAHPGKPAVHVVSGCPSINTSFAGHEAKVRELCIRYDPVDNDPVASLGYRGGGALIAFAHGVPNNSPRILHCRSQRWAPLFPGRVTAVTRAYFTKHQDTASVASRLIRMHQRRLANGQWLFDASSIPQLMLVMAALSRGPRFDEALSRKTGLTVLEVRGWVKHASEQGWIDINRRLTDQGQAQLWHARKPMTYINDIYIPPEEFYYPSSLRAPRVSSS